MYPSRASWSVLSTSQRPLVRATRRRSQNVTYTWNAAFSSRSRGIVAGGSDSIHAAEYSRHRCSPPSGGGRKSARSKGSGVPSARVLRAGVSWRARGQPYVRSLVRAGAPCRARRGSPSRATRARTRCPTCADPPRPPPESAPRASVEQGGQMGVRAHQVDGGRGGAEGRGVRERVRAVVRVAHVRRDVRDDERARALARVEVEQCLCAVSAGRAPAADDAPSAGA